MLHFSTSQLLTELFSLNAKSLLAKITLEKMLRRQASEKCVSTRQKRRFTGDTVTVTLRSSNIFVPNIPPTIPRPCFPQNFTTEFQHKLTMAFIMQRWLLRDWRQWPEDTHFTPAAAAFWRNLDKCRDQCCIINVNVSRWKQTFDSALDKNLFEYVEATPLIEHYVIFLSPSKIINKFDQ